MTFLLLYVRELVGTAAEEIGKVSTDVKFFLPITLQLQQLIRELATTPRRAQSAISIKKANFRLILIVVRPFCYFMSES